MADNHSSSNRSRGGSRQAPSRRSDVVRCENCGEDYAVTYKRCPFCDERPGRAGGFVSGGRRVANTRGGGYGGGVNPLQIAIFAVSLAVIIAAAVIVFRYIGAPLFGGDPGGASVSTGQNQGGGAGSQGPDSSQTLPGGGEALGEGGQSPEGDGSQTGDASTGTQPSAGVESVTLNKTDITLTPNEVTTLTATVSPAGTEEPVVWSSSDESVLTVDQEGNLRNVNAGGGLVRVTVTATCGDKTAQCVVYCRTSNPGGQTQTEQGGSSSGGGAPVAPNTPGTIVNAGSGLNVRSGPGREFDRVASISNGARVTILGEENGWYQIEYSPGAKGYVSGEYVAVG